MPEYLTPGVYVEEFDSGAVPMQGASTSTAGFLGAAEKGPVRGLPELITSFADFRRLYGGYLSKEQAGNYRFLAYAVEHFFVNGGSRCYVTRVAPADAAAAHNFDPASVLAEGDKPFRTLHIAAKNPGDWGNSIRVSFEATDGYKTVVRAEVDAAKAQYRVKDAYGLSQGDVVRFAKGKDRQLFTIKSVRDDIIELDVAIAGFEPDQNEFMPENYLIVASFAMTITYGGEQEKFEGLSMNTYSPHYVTKVLGKSKLVDVQDLRDRDEYRDALAEQALELTVTLQDETATPFALATGQPDEVAAADAAGVATFKRNAYSYQLEAGKDGTISAMQADRFIGDESGGPGQRTGLASFLDNEEVAIMAIPGVTDLDVQVRLVAHCETLKSRFAILDLPIDLTKPDDILVKHRNLFDSSYAAIYNPWLQVFDPLEKRSIYIPPSASMAGVYSRTDVTRGVHKAPANEVVRGTTGLYVQYNNGEQDILNPRGVNLIRAFTGQGIRVWGARTLSSNGLWKYVNVRRLFIYVEESIKRNTNWVVFEPNDQPLWDRVHRTIDNFLTTTWRSGALQGGSPAEAFYVNIGRTTMTQDDIDNGRLICEIGIAPVKPAEFVIFRLTQKTSE